MKINVISHDNGVGLSRDSKLIMDLCKEEGHDVSFVELGSNRDKHPVKRCDKADVNIFNELINPLLLGYAKINVLIPNPEWFWETHRLNHFKYILAKTKHCERVFKNLKNTKEVIFTSFTCEDRQIKDVKKENVFLHFCGKSSFKNTQAVHKCWRENSNLPALYFGIYGDNGLYKHFNRDNIIDCYTRLPEDLFKKLQNKTRFHICTSEYEGFGHYIWEAMSTGAIIITTDAEPMNSFVDTNGFLVRYQSTKKHNLGTLHKIRDKDLLPVIQQAMKLSEHEMNKMSERSRYIFEQNDKYFRKTFKSFLNYIK